MEIITSQTLWLFLYDSYLRQEVMLTHRRGLYVDRITTGGRELFPIFYELLE